MIKLAFTGSAAYNINGITIHSALNLTVNSSRKDHIEITHELEKRWKSISLIIIDEISISPGYLIERLNKVLQAIHKNKLHFGGVHVIFFGDFFQHVAIADKIYDSEIWKSLNGSIILEEQMRARSDTEFVTLLKSIRNRNVEKEDYDSLRINLLSNQPIDYLSDEWFDAPYITTRKETNYKINNIKCLHYSMKNNAKIHVISAHDTCGELPLKSIALQNYVKKKHSWSTSSNKLQRVLRVCVGSRITLSENIKDLSKYGLTNGCNGTVFAIVSDHLHSKYVIHDNDANTTYYTKPPIILFKPDKLDERHLNFKYENIEERGIFPIFPKVELFTALFKQSELQKTCN